MLSKDQLTHKITLSEKHQETPDTQSLVFQIPSDLQEKFKYKPGQFITIFLNIDGEEVRRSYSLSSSPDWDDQFKVTVKRVKGGLVSNHLIDQVQTGDQLHLTPPAGLFCLPDTNIDQLVLFAGGSGITPIISLLKSALKSGAPVTLLYASRNEASIIFKDELDGIQKDFESSFQCVHHLSERDGRLGSTQIESFLGGLQTPVNTHYFMCGPEGLMDTCLATLELGGVSKDFIHRESFASPAPKASGSAEALAEIGEDAVFIGDKSQASELGEIQALLDGENLVVSAQKGVSVLETLLEAGHNPPYSCMDGACMACMGKVEDGLVYQDDMGILTEDNLEAGECLTCQAKPASKNLKISFDL